MGVWHDDVQRSALAIILLHIFLPKTLAINPPIPYPLTMFKRYKKMPNGTIKVQIAKSKRTEGHVRQKILRHVGTAQNEKDRARLEKFADEIILDLKAQEGGRLNTLFNLKEYDDLSTKSCQADENPVPDHVRLGACQEEGRAYVGVRQIFGEVYRSLGFQAIGGHGRRGGNRYIREMTLARIARPQSKRATIKTLFDQSTVALNLDLAYRSMDYLDAEKIARLRDRSMKAARRLLPEPMTALFYDVTTLSFASEKADELRRKGFRKDGKHHRVQVMLALMMTSEGLPVGYEVFPGDSSEGQTLMVAVDHLRDRYPEVAFTLVADAVMITKANEAALQERGIPYVLGARIKKLPAALTQEVLRRDKHRQWSGAEYKESIASYRPMTIARDRNVMSTKKTRVRTDAAGHAYREDDYRRLIVTYSQKRAAKDRNQREEKVAKLSKQLATSTQPSALASGGKAKYLSFPKGQVVLSNAKIEQLAAWDGLRGVIAWNCPVRDARTLVAKYRDLAAIEACFRVNKHDLKIRPVYHWRERRVQSHLALCYMAFCCLQHLRYRLQVRGHPMSPGRIQEALNKMQISIVHDRRHGGLYGMPSAISSDGKKICQAVGMRWNRAPFMIAGDKQAGADIEFDVDA